MQARSLGRAGGDPSPSRPCREIALALVPQGPILVEKYVSLCILLQYPHSNWRQIAFTLFTMFFKPCLQHACFPPRFRRFVASQTWRICCDLKPDGAFFAEIGRIEVLTVYDRRWMVGLALNMASPKRMLIVVF